MSTQEQSLNGETRLPRVMTIRECYEPAMEITDQAAADIYFELLVERQMRVFAKSREEAERDERISLGYYAGYYDTETRERVERLFRCAHPYFGAYAERGPVRPEDAFHAGVALASGHAVEMNGSP